MEGLWNGHGRLQAAGDAFNEPAVATEGFSSAVLSPWLPSGHCPEITGQSPRRLLGATFPAANRSLTLSIPRIDGG